MDQDPYATEYTHVANFLLDYGGMAAPFMLSGEWKELKRQAYAEAIASFHERWFWRNTDKADFSLSHLNRHYALHSLGTNTFYRAIDCHRLFLYFDTFADMLM